MQVKTAEPASPTTPSVASNQPTSIPVTADGHPNGNANASTPSMLPSGTGQLLPGSNPNWFLLNVGLPAMHAAQVDPDSTSINFSTDPSTHLVRVTTTLLVPPTPAAHGTTFVAADVFAKSQDATIKSGNIESVLTWGPSCAPNQLPNDTYAFYWISPQYVSTACLGGPAMRVAPGDGLLLDFILVDNTWTLTVTNLTTQQSVSYTIDMPGPRQYSLAFWAETTDNAPPPADIVLLDTTLTLADAVSNPIHLDSLCSRCFVASMTASQNGKSFLLPRMVLRFAGVPQTYPN